MTYNVFSGTLNPTHSLGENGNRNRGQFAFVHTLNCKLYADKRTTVVIERQVTTTCVEYLEESGN